MTGYVGGLAMAAVFFVASHFVLSHPPVRGALVSHIGEKLFRAVYSIVALASVAWLVAAYGAAPYVELWPAADWTRLVPLMVMPVAAILLVAGVTTRNPTAMYWIRPAEVATVPGILKVTRHPVMWAVALWALAHMVANGDLASLIFLAAFAGLALAGMPAIDRHRRAMMGKAWESFEAVTSVLPFAALATGRARLRIGEISLWRIAAGVALYVAMLFAHGPLIGGAILPG